MMIYIDGFDSYPTADLPKRWSDILGAGYLNSSISSSSGRNGTGCLSVTTGNAGNFHQIGRSFGSPKTTVSVGFAVKFAALGNATGGSFCDLYDGGSQNLVLKVDNVGNLLLYTGSTLIVSYGAGIITGAWYYVEIQFTVSNSIPANSCKIRLNGVTVITAPTGTNMKAGTNTTVDRLILGTDNGWLGANAILYDDLYIFDSTGSTNNALIGDVRVETIRPTGAGASTQWTPSTGANYAAVNETAEDGDTTYISSGTLLNADTYAMGDLSSTPATVYGVQVAITGRKDDAGTRTVAGAIKSGSTTYDHTTTNALGLGDSYVTLIDVWEADPNGSVAWTGTTINAMEAGVKLAG